MAIIGERGATYKQFRTRLLTACAAIVVLLAAGAAWKINADYNAAIETTIAQTSNLVLAVEAHVVETIDTLDAPLTALAETIARRKTEGDVTAREIKSLLTSPLLPGTAKYWVMFIDTQGTAVAASNDLPVAGVFYGDREYFAI